MENEKPLGNQKNILISIKVPIVKLEQFFNPAITRLAFSAISVSPLMSVRMTIFTTRQSPR